MLPDDFPINAYSTDYAIKDITYALELAADCGVETPGADLAKAILEKTSAAGFARNYFPVLMKSVKVSGT